MERDEFYDKFPWVFSLPERPQCKECFCISSWEIRDGDLFLYECHNEKCSRQDGTMPYIMELPKLAKI